MIASKYRLRGRYYFERAKKKGIIYQSNNFGLVVLKRDDNSPTRFGFVVSTKVSKLAVDRNRIRRVLDDAVRYNITRIKNGYDVVFLTKPRIIREKIENLMREVDSSLKTAKLIKKS